MSLVYVPQQHKIITTTPIQSRSERRDKKTQTEGKREKCDALTLYDLQGDCLVSYRAVSYRLSNSRLQNTERERIRVREERERYVLTSTQYNKQIHMSCQTVQSHRKKTPADKHSRVGVKGERDSQPSKAMTQSNKKRIELQAEGNRKGGRVLENMGCVRCDGVYEATFVGKGYTAEL
ncbi:hypothetical protein BDV98DRAFT_47608 [Pterulicium gracile]|uniref:Uncharacterized protein n=1 Tax=Pterulicium gracile TaxID=1884261 RepID=A0A5C3QJ02_9AGAR|nr:hypothetical protein BDV98DRAFT_47608 [Pterula gracilis]